MGLIKSIRKKIKKKLASKNRETVIKKYLDKLFPDLIVKHGPFQGMKYPGINSISSSIFPKLMGSYERELASVLTKICRSNYSEIIDVGCAEGYYAVGLALRHPNSQIYAFDTDVQAQALCQEMAALNDVQSDRFIINGLFDIQELRKFHFSGKSLIVCDCEGFEKNLFTPDAPNLLSNHELLIETHDCIDIEISSYLYSIFKDTHHIDIVSSTDDIQKAKYYEYDELSNCTLEIRKILLAERRATIMEWFYMIPKTLQNSGLS